MIRYEYPGSIPEAVYILSEMDGKARILAGGTDLLPELRAGEQSPECLVDITQIPELHKIEIQPEAITVGATVTFSDLIRDPFLKDQVPILVQAAASVGAGGIQQAATWAGNIVQAMPAADGIIAALALEAEVKLINSGGENWVPVEDLFQGPGISKVDSTRELVAGIRFPLHPDDSAWGTAWKRIGRRSALVLPILNCGVKLVLQDKSGTLRIKKAILALGPVGPQPFRAKIAEEWLIGKSPEDAVFQQAGELAREEAQPRSSILRASKEYRRKIIPVLVRDAFQESVLISLRK
ncbi:MAG: FAD binding domain-containing protein [Chloroflexi bacterium]|nr:FAD binding domain-containing protein [Chloroflexota bacterium]